MTCNLHASNGNSGACLILPVLFGCSDTRSLWRDQVLPSGKSIKVISCNLVWGSEHDQRDPDNDSFTLEYVSANPQGDPQARELEAVEVFELIRPISELRKFNHASLAGFPAMQRKGHYDVFVFTRNPDGKWACNRYPAKIFVND